MTRTKIICTLGPASAGRTVLEKMMRAGMDVGRLNFSHGSPQDALKKIRIIRLMNKTYRRRIKLLGDLQGHRIRVGDLPAPLLLEKNQVVWLTQKNIKGTQKKIPFDYRGPLRGVKNGQRIFLDDGNIALQVIGRARESLKVRVLFGGWLQGHKGVNIPEARLEFDGISRKDVADISFCREHGVEFVAQSFVCGKKDIRDVKKALGEGSTLPGHRQDREQGRDRKYR